MDAYIFFEKVIQKIYLGESKVLQYFGRYLFAARH